MRWSMIVSMLVCLSLPQISIAADDAALANAADTCNSTAYDILKPQRKKAGARDLMNATANGKKFAKWMKKYLRLLNKCDKEPFLSDCEPKSKVIGYRAKLSDSKKELEGNMLSNYVCTTPYVNKIIADNIPVAKVKPELDQKIAELIKAAGG